MATRITVVGGGYAGMALIRRLAGREGILLTLIDQNPYHTVLTEIHQVAAGNREPETLQFPYAALSGCRFIQARVHGLNPQAKQVLTSAGPVEYDILVLALGGVDADFGVPGVQEHTFRLHSLKEALAIRSRLDQLPEDAPVVIAGGGLTGVELAAEIGLRRRGAGNITLVEAAPSVLPGLARKLQLGARRRLGSLGVNVLTGTPIARVEEKMVHFKDGSALPFALMVWACGVKGHPLVAQMGIPVDGRGRALVDETMQTAVPDVYALGDCAAGGLPPTAQVANQQGTILANYLLARIRGEERPLEQVAIRGTLVDLGHTFGVGSLGDSLKMVGLLPAFLKRANVARWMITAAGFSAALRYFLGLQDWGVRRSRARVKSAE